MVFLSAETVKKRPGQCPSCTYFHAEIDRCRAFRKGGMLAMFGGETNESCQEYKIADFEGIVKTVNEERNTAVFGLEEMDAIFEGVPVFKVPDETLRQFLRSHIGGPPVLFSVRNGKVVAANPRK
jgi:hypothetical protein